MQVFYLISAFIYWQLSTDAACDNDEANDDNNDDNDGSGLRLRHHKDDDSANTDNDNNEDNQTAPSWGDAR